MQNALRSSLKNDRHFFPWLIEIFITAIFSLIFHNPFYKFLWFSIILNNRPSIILKINPLVKKEKVF